MTDDAPAGLRIPCTQCGGPLPVADDAPFVVCTHCRATLFLDLGRYVRHGTVRPRLHRADAESALRLHLESVEAEPPERIDGMSLELRPWYVVPAARGAVAVAAFADDDGADPAPAGRAALSAETVPFEGAGDRGAAVVPPSILADAAVAQAEGGRAEGVRLVHVPVFVATWRHRGEPYRAVVDAVLGSVAASRLPPRAGSSMDTRAILVLGGATAACAVQAALLPGVLLPLVANAVTAAAVVFLGSRGRSA